jgi:hypothetical protein
MAKLTLPYGMTQSVSRNADGDMILTVKCSRWALVRMAIDMLRAGRITISPWYGWLQVPWRLLRLLLLPDAERTKDIIKKAAS